MSCSGHWVGSAFAFFPLELPQEQFHFDCNIFWLFVIQLLGSALARLPWLFALATVVGSALLLCASRISVRFEKIVKTARESFCRPSGLVPCLLSLPGLASGAEYAAPRGLDPAGAGLFSTVFRAGSPIKRNIGPLDTCFAATSDVP